LAGTPLFLPPEMFMRHWGPEADLWSLGMVAYQLLSGAGVQQTVAFGLGVLVQMVV
jgi:serine/threonine protein kinase